MYNFTRLNQEERENMNSPISSNKIELIIKNKVPGPDGFIGEFYQTFKEELTYPSQTVPKNCRGWNTSEFILQVQHHPNTKTKDTTKKKIIGQYH